MPQTDVGRSEALLDELLGWVRLETPTTDAAAVNRLMDVAAAELAGAGAALTRIPGRDGFADNLIARTPGAGTPVLVAGHLDTVWSHGSLDAMPARVEGEKAFGPGIYDMKAGSFLALHVLRAILRQGVRTPRPVVLLLTPDEEVGSPSSRAWIEREAAQAARVLIMEPAGPGGACVTARKGVGRFVLRIAGRGAHAGGAFEEGASAVVELAQQIQAVHAMVDIERGITLNAAPIWGGTRPNVIPPEAGCEIDLRVSTAADGVEMENRLAALAARTPGCTVTVEGAMNRPPFAETPAIAALHARARILAREAGFELPKQSRGGGSDGNFTAALGVPTLDGLGCPGAGAHVTSEHILWRAPGPARHLAGEPAGDAGLTRQRPSPAGSAQATHDERADRVGHRQGKPLPGGHEVPVFRVKRALVGDAGAGLEAEAVVQRRRLEPPVPLEGVGPGADLAAPEIIQPAAPFGRPAHHLPIHKVVAGPLARHLRAASVIGQHFLAMVEVQHGGDRRLAVVDCHDVAAVAEGLHEYFEIAAREHRGAEVTDALGVDVVQRPRVVIGSRDEAVLDALAHHRPLLARDRLHVPLRIGLNRLPECLIQGGTGHPLSAVHCFAEAEFHRRDACPPHQGGSMIPQGPRALRIRRERAAIDAEWHRDQRAAEQQRPHMGERQDPGDRAVALREGVVRRAPNAVSMTDCQAARWKNVPSGRERTKPSQADALAGPSTLTATLIQTLPKPATAPPHTRGALNTAWKRYRTANGSGGCGTRRGPAHSHPQADGDAMTPAYLDPRTGQTFPLEPPRWCGPDHAPLLLTPLPGLTRRRDRCRDAQPVALPRGAAAGARDDPITLGRGLHAAAARAPCTTRRRC